LTCSLTFVVSSVVKRSEYPDLQPSLSMCRLLAITAAAPFELAPHLRAFAQVARNSREYQGHGWGCTWQDAGAWRVYHSAVPVWEDDLGQFDRARVLMAHARSAFRDEGIAVENNMPFVQDGLAFVFNGELRRVRIAETGRIGAEKLFRFLARHGAARNAEGARTALRLVRQRTRHIRAMNFVIGSPGAFLVCSSFSEDDEYFTIHARRGQAMTTVCSEAYEPGGCPDREPCGWAPLPNGTIEVIPWFS